MMEISCLAKRCFCVRLELKACWNAKYSETISNKGAVFVYVMHFRYSILPHWATKSNLQFAFTGSPQHCNWHLRAFIFWYTSDVSQRKAQIKGYYCCQGNLQGDILSFSKGGLLLTVEAISTGHSTPEENIYKHWKSNAMRRRSVPDDFFILARCFPHGV